MQDVDWNDLKYFLALIRRESFAEAGRHLGVDETTVARRLRRLERALGAALFIKSSTGRYGPSDAGSDILARAERIESEHAAILDQLGRLTERVSGRVRISSVPYIANRCLLPAIAELETRHPDLTVDLVPDARNVDLSKREADLAVRFSRPSTGGLEVKGQKLGDMAFGPYCAANLTDTQAIDLDWIGYDDAHASLPQARWTETLRAGQGPDHRGLRVADLDTAHEAAALGLGKAILPITVAEQDMRIRRIPMSGCSDMTRAVWLLSHGSSRHQRAIAAAKAWISDVNWT